MTSYKHFFFLTGLLLFASKLWAFEALPQDTIWKKYRNGTTTFEIYNGEVDLPPRWRNQFSINFGFNRWATSMPDDYGLRFFPSNHFSVAFSKARQIGGSKSPWRLQGGLEAAWYYFRFQNDAYIQKGEQEITFENNGFGLSRNQLTCLQIQLPISLRYEFLDSEYRQKMHLAIGFYAGYIVHRFARARFEDAEGNTRDIYTYNDFFLNPWQWGLRAEWGYSYFHLFAKYQISPLFQAGRAPEAQVLTLGLGLHL